MTVEIRGNGTAREKAWEMVQVSVLVKYWSNTGQILNSEATGWRGRRRGSGLDIHPIESAPSRRRR
jgi:hypothetical protein